PRAGEGAPDRARARAAPPRLRPSAGEHLPYPPRGELPARAKPQPVLRGVRMTQPGARVPVDGGDGLAADRHLDPVAALEGDDQGAAGSGYVAAPRGVPGGPPGRR